MVKRQRDAQRLVVVSPWSQARPAKLLVTLEALHVAAPALFLDIRLARRTCAYIMVALPLAIPLVHFSAQSRAVVVSSTTHARLSVAFSALHLS
jgi:hypothetical protein